MAAPSHYPAYNGYEQYGPVCDTDLTHYADRQDIENLLLEQFPPIQLADGQILQPYYIKVCYFSYLAAQPQVVRLRTSASG